MKGLREKKPAPVCIAGMHRSGTSTVAQLLSKCGLYLGSKDDLVAAGPANPDGYWENKRFLAINRRILEVYRSGWDLPPSLEDGWQNGEAMRPLRLEAEHLLGDFEGREPWGWKDPRSCLTLPFWTSLLPDAKVVVCLRNPLEVAVSLRRRGNSTLAFGLNLWMVYHQMLLDALAPGQYIVTHYEAYFYRPQEELRRVLDFLRLPASEQLVAQARTSTMKSLRHHSFTTRQVLDANPPPQLPELYLRLCREADWDSGQPETSEPVSARRDHLTI